MSPRFSIIVAVLNGAQTLQRCIDSLLRQTDKSWELIVMDGGSTDATLEILEGNRSAISHWESRQDNGITEAWNRGLDHARGSWIYFLGADDRFENDRVLEKIAAAISENLPKSTRVLYGAVNVVDENGDIIETRGRIWAEVSRQFRREKMTIPHQGCFVHRTIFTDRGKFDESFRIAADYEFLLRELKERDAFFVEDLTIAQMENRGVSNRLETQLMALEEESRALELRSEYGVPFSKRVKRRLLATLISMSEIIGERPIRVLLDTYLALVGKPKRWTV